MAFKTLPNNGDIWESETTLKTTLHEMVLQAAVPHSDRTAVCFDQCDDRLPVYFTYKTVVEMAAELTRFLQTHCDPQETREIGLCCYPGIRLPSWILGILQVPAAYCPIDPDAPTVYSAYFMRKCNLKYVLVEASQVDKFQSSYASQWSQHSIPGSHLGLTLFKLHWNGVDGHLPAREGKEECAEEKTRDAGSFPNGSGGDPGASVDAGAPGRLAYVLHTSGTTGVPKIVRVPHRCITPNIQHFRAIFRVRPDDVLFMASPLTFDPSVVDLFVALTSGASLLMVPDAVKMVPSQLAAALFHRHGVTVLQATPTLLRRFGARLLKSTALSAGSPLRVLALGGEPFPALATFRSWRAEGNGTQVFNVYGVTEVSSWATCYRIPAADLDPSSSSESPVPLGAPLLGTIVEVRDPDGCRIEDGDGQVFIGGEERVCFLDDETTVPSGTMRATGDLVTVKGEDLFFLGRKDGQIKRHGKRLNLEGVQQAAERLCGAEACAVTWGPREGLLLFVVPSGRLAKEQLLGELERRLPRHALPDDLVFVEALPFTSHGKIDRPALTKMYWSHRKLNGACKLRGEEQLWERLQDIWTSVLRPGGDPRGVPKDSLFLSSGGDSLKCLRFLEEVEGLVGTAVPGLLEVILSRPISEIHSHVLRAAFPSDTATRKRRRGERVDPEPGKPGGADPGPEPGRPGGADPGPEPGGPGGTDPEPATFVAVSRGSQVSELSAPSRGPAGRRAGPGALTLRVRWRSDTGRCVDASPLVAVGTAAGDSSATVYVGSHSGRLQALDLRSGRLKWERVLGDRVESSACLSRCGRLVAVGPRPGSSCPTRLLRRLRLRAPERHWGNALAVRHAGRREELCGSGSFHGAPLRGLSRPARVRAGRLRAEACLGAALRRRSRVCVPVPEPGSAPPLRRYAGRTLGGRQSGERAWRLEALVRKAPLLFAPVLPAGGLRRLRGRESLLFQPRRRTGVAAVHGRARLLVPLHLGSGRPEPLPRLPRRLRLLLRRGRPSAVEVRSLGPGVRHPVRLPEPPPGRRDLGGRGLHGWAAVGAGRRERTGAGHGGAAWAGLLFSRGLGCAACRRLQGRRRVRARAGTGRPRPLTGTAAGAVGPPPGPRPVSLHAEGSWESEVQSPRVTVTPRAVQSTYQPGSSSWPLLTPSKSPADVANPARPREPSRPRDPPWTSGRPRRRPGETGAELVERGSYQEKPRAPPLKSTG
ncbi:beta-alanine-activating enzyme isoform X2 [Ornithorhynchus anatinus]|uniref:beta-alanine-activating enzyme isoform X2 n=1 Tax=Ornithorhynchus anatinus TaxID=9258 RepID=UPI0010A94B6D|nr:beta-alanine-activating enzyme isoform X2 [Ornithorhynchus anatinus]